MTATSTDVANEAIQLMGGNQPLVTGVAPNFDSSTNGVILSKIYVPAVQTVARQFAWDFGRNISPLNLTGNTAPFPWAFEYFYPASAVQIWQLVPPSFDDANNPLPTTWSVGNALFQGIQRKVIWTDLANALVVANNAPAESTWDPLFREAVVRLLASGLAMASAGKPDTAQAMLESGAAFESLGEGRAD